MTALEAIRLLIKSDGKATRTSIRQVAPDLSHRHIAETLAANSQLLKRNKAGAVTGLVSFGFDHFVKSGRKVYRRVEVDNYGHHLFWKLTFPDSDDLKEKHETSGWVGGIGDSARVSGPKDSAELRAELEARGYVEWSAEMGATEAFWAEDERA